MLKKTRTIFIDNRSYIGLFAILLVIGIFYGYIPDPTGGYILQKNTNTTVTNTTVVTTQDNVQNTEQMKGNKHWWLFLGIGVAIGCSLRKTADYIGKGIIEVNSDIKAYAAHEEGIRYLQKLKLSEVGKGIWVGYYLVNSSHRETGGKYWSGDCIEVRYEGSKIKKFDVCMFDPVGKHFITPETTRKPTESSILDNLKWNKKEDDSKVNPNKKK